ncbi:DNA-binding transcriptional regulator, LysR family [Propionispira arboris]|uniref:DNA-binding transcriptional regulator, LysR family n=1 Tax=Propionispira arboris TaxID=84035 RepID=A0A1H7AZ75_9FIRM|nr:LysR family transcriptional regulator [Propionispira arboris]SEJ70893.1 DNA-binding transcriptional regulator, LysR family [Propionispira arboris]
MTLRHLNIFLCVCDENNMTRAAAQLHMTQPSVSQAIQELEEHYEVLLFERLGRRLFITEAGQRLLSYAQRTMSLHQQTELAMREFGQVYHLRIGASVTIGECVLIDLIQYMYEMNPNQDIVSEIHNTAELEKMLLQDELDLALVEGVIQSESLIAQPFLADELIFIASPQSAFLEKKEISLMMLKKMKFFVREDGSGTRDLFTKLMQQHAVDFEISGVYNNAETIKKAVIAGLGVSVISRRAVKNELARGELCSFTVEDLSFKRDFHIVYHKDKYISKELQATIELCRNIEGIL